MKDGAPPLDPWTTFAALVAAAAGVLRVHKRLMLFPLMLVLVLAVQAIVGPAVMYLALTMEGRHADTVQAFMSSRSGILLLSLGTWCWFWMSLTVVALALAHASLHALREMQVSLWRALGRALARPFGLLGGALLSASLTVAFANPGPHDPWPVRAGLAVLWLAWTLIWTFTLTMMTGERLGVLAALRRSVVLLRARWAEGRLTPIGLGLLWLPLFGVQALAMLWVPWSQADSWVWAGLDFALVSLTWLLGRLYAAAVYCYVVEGVVPAAFAGPSLEALWRVAPPAGPGFVLPERLRAGTYGPRSTPSTTLHLPTLLVVTAVTIGALGLDVQRLRLAGALDRLFPGPALTVDAVNFGPGPRVDAVHQLVLTGTILTGIAAVKAVRNETGPVIFLFGNDRLFRLRKDLTIIDVLPLPAIADEMRNVETLELGPGRGVLVGTNNPAIISSHDAVVAFDWFGNIIFQRTTEHGAGVDAIAPIRIGSDWGVAVGYNGDYGLCLLDSHGLQRWCNKDVGNVQIVSSIDCDRDGQEDILSISDDEQRLACYDVVTGRNMAGIEVPRTPYLLQALDLDGDGRKELGYLDVNVDDTHRLGIWRGDGSPLAEVQFANAPSPVGAQHHETWLGRSKPIAARRAPGGARDLVVVGPGGTLVGLSPTGKRWHAGENQNDAVAIDLDGDGVDEIVSFECRTGGFPVVEHTVNVWSWHPRATPVVPRLSTFPARPARPLQSVGRPALNPVHTFGRSASDDFTSVEEMTFTAGCRAGIAIARGALPKIVQRDRRANDEKMCAQDLSDLDVSRVDAGVDLSWNGCWSGIGAVLEKYFPDSPGFSGDYHQLARDCVADVHQRPRLVPPRAGHTASNAP